MDLLRGWAFLLLAPMGLIGCDRDGGTVPSPTGGAVPTFEYTATSGCSDIIVYQTNHGPTETFVVSADSDQLGIKPGRSSFELASAPKDLSVTIRVYPRPQRHLHLCTDFTDPESDKPFVWTAVSGRVTIERFPPDPSPEGMSRTFRVKVTVEDAELTDMMGRRVKCPRPIILDTTVGWVPG
jgi:hypothetical protein